MPVQATYPGVYVEEIPSGVRTITGVATSVAAFIGYFKRGPVNKAVQIFSMGDFEREFGGLDLLSEAGYAIQQFFLNGGSQAHVIRVASGTINASNATLADAPGGTEAIRFRAIHEGIWGNNIRIKIDHDTVADGEFNMVVSEYNDSGTVLRQEAWLNLSMDDSKTNFATTVINDENTGSDIIRVDNTNTLNPPSANGTHSGEHADPATVTITNSDADKNLNVFINGKATTNPANFSLPAGNYTLTDLALRLENALRSLEPANPVLSASTVRAVGNRLHILAGGNDPVTIISFEDSGDDAAIDLKLTNDASANIQEYSLGLNEHSSFAFEIQSTAWVFPKLYEIGDLVIDDDGNTYRCIISHTSDDDALVITNTTNWLLLANAWATTITYVVGEMVTENDIVYRCLVGHDAVVFATDLDADNWITVASWELLLVNTNIWATATVYVEGEMVTETNILYRCLVRHTAAVFATDLATGNWVVIESLPISLVSAQLSGLPGDNGDLPDGNALIGNENDKEGFYALEDVDLFNILCIPRTAITSGDDSLTETEAATVMTRAIGYCGVNRAFFIMDTPLGIDNFQEINNWMSANNNLRSKNAALYFPRVKIPDPLNNFRLRSVGASGTIAGLYARTDTNRGVWKAPAGTEATLKGVSQIEYILSDGENGVLNPLAINSLRNFPVYGSICWGARTMEGTNALASEWKYVPVRRLALFLEESLFRGTHWVVFEPNDEPLWAQIRLNVGAFMNNLFKQGAFQGTSPKDAYLVKCDKETTTQNDINLGIVNIVVGFAPLKPAEFVFIKIQQLVGQIET